MCRTVAAAAFNRSNSLDNRVRRFRPFVAILGKQVHDQFRNLGGQIRIEFVGRLGLLRCDGEERRHDVLAAEGHPSRTHAIEDAAEAEEVAAAIDLLAAGLFRRHERGGAEDGPGLRQVGIVGGGASQAEVEDLDPPALPFKPDVGRLDVAVDQAVPVCDGKPLGDLSTDTERLLQRGPASRLRRSASTSPSRNSIARKGMPRSSPT